MSVTPIDLDDDALAETMRLSGAKSTKDTVNVAPCEYAARHRRIEALEHYASSAKGSDYQGWQELHDADRDLA